MSIKRQYSQRHKKYLYKLDIRITTSTGRRRFRAHDFETKGDAEAALAEIRGQERQSKYGLPPVVERPRLSDLIEQKLAATHEGPEKTRDKRVLGEWLALLPNDIRVDEITTPMIRLYADKRRRDGQAESSVDRELSTISATLSVAGDFFPELLQWQKPKIPRPKLSKSRRERVITDAEYQAIVSHLTRPLDSSDGARVQHQRNAYNARLRIAAIFRFAMATGMRPKEIYTLPWANIEWDGNRIKVEGTKTQKKGNAVRYVPLSKTIREILEGQKKFAAKRRFIFTGGGKATTRMREIFKEAAIACGIPYGNKKPDGVVLYCARHTFTTKLVQSGLDMRTVGDITGHSDKKMILHYSHVTPESRARAVLAMDEIESRRNISGHNNGHNSVEEK